jgi:hypothetical protein
MALYLVHAQLTVPRRAQDACEATSWRCALDMVQGTSKISKGFAHLSGRSNLCARKPARLGNPEDRL